MAIKKKVAEVVEEVKKVVEEVKEVDAAFDADIDHWLVKWAKTPFSGWLACGFGVALLLIGGVIGATVF